MKLSTQHSLARPPWQGRSPCRGRRPMPWQAALITVFLASAALAQSADLAELKSLRELPKPTAFYTSSLSTFWTTLDPAIASEWCRILGTVPVGLQDDAARQSRAVGVARARRLPIVLTIYGWQETATFASREITDADRNRLEQVRTLARRFNALAGDVKVSRILIDWEPNGWRQAAYYTPARDLSAYDKGSHTLGVKRRVQYLYDLLREEFPASVQDWYKNRSLSFQHGWEADTHGSELIDLPLLNAILLAPPLNHNMTVYDSDRFWFMRQKIEKNLEAAKRRGAKLSVTLGLGFSYPLAWQHRESDSRWIIAQTDRQWAIPSEDIYRLATMVYHPSFQPPDFPGNTDIEFVSWYPALYRTDWRDGGRYILRNALQVVYAARQLRLPDALRVDPAADLDHDGDVDMNDFGLFQRQVMSHK